LAEPITQGGGEILGASFIDVNDDDFTRSQSQKGVSHSGAGSTGSELNHAIAADIGQFSPETLCEAPPIGIVPDAATVFQNDGVDGTECSCVGRELIKQGDYRLFAGMGDIDAGKIKPFGSREDLRKGAGIETEHFQVDQFVNVTQSLLSPLPFVKTGRSGCLDTGAYQADKDGGIGPQA